MKTIIVACLMLFAGFSSAAYAGAVQGQPVVNGYFLSCSVPNYTPYALLVLGIQYQYTCQNPYTGQFAVYTPYFPCTGNCWIVPGAVQTFAGPSDPNCNLVAAACVATTRP